MATCRECGCTDDRACLGGCHWVEPDLCSRCVQIKRAINLMYILKATFLIDPDRLDEACASIQSLESNLALRGIGPLVDQCVRLPICQEVHRKTGARCRCPHFKPSEAEACS